MYVYYQSVLSTLLFPIRLLQGPPHLFVVDLCGWVQYIRQTRVIKTHYSYSVLTNGSGMMLHILWTFISQGDLEARVQHKALSWPSLTTQGVDSTSLARPWPRAHFQPFSVARWRALFYYMYVTLRKAGDVVLVSTMITSPIYCASCLFPSFSMLHAEKKCFCTCVQHWKKSGRAWEQAGFN